MMASFTIPSVRGEILFDVPMRDYNTWNVGGNAECVYKPADLEDLSDFMSSIEEDVAITWLGLGSNVLIRDGGIAGVVIVTQGCLNKFEFLDDDVVMAQAGVACAKLARQTNKKGLTGLEFMAGIPGTVGGALAMNAGAHGATTWNQITTVSVINRHGEITKKNVDQFQFGYRSLEMPIDEWFVSAWFKLQKQEAANNIVSIKELLKHRAESQPIGKKNCGSVFMNPPNNYAAKLIEESGLKGLSVGGAKVSEKHANFIINEKDASAYEIEQLINMIKQHVAQKFGIELEAEVKILGKEKD